jgi:hypothetical protein
MEDHVIAAAVSDRVIFLLIVSALFWVGIRKRSVWYWITAIVFGCMIDWPTAIPRAIHQLSDSDALLVQVGFTLMGVVAALSYRAEKWRSSRTEIDRFIKN